MYFDLVNVFLLEEELEENGVCSDVFDSPLDLGRVAFQAVKPHFYLLIANRAQIHVQSVLNELGEAEY